MRGTGVSAFGSLAITVTEVSDDASSSTRSAGFGNVLYIEPRDVYLFSLLKGKSLQVRDGLPLVVQ